MIIFHSNINEMFVIYDIYSWSAMNLYIYRLFNNVNSSDSVTPNVTMINEH
jgi:hypothetical protein